MPWNIRRDFHIDINAAYGSFLLVSATDSSLRQPPPDMVAGDGMPVRFYFWERGIAGALIAADPGPDTVFIFSGRPASAPSGSDLLYVTNDFTEIEAGVWEGTLDLNTAEFASHLEDSSPKTILGELEVRDSVANTKRNSFQFDLTARRQVYQAEDATPTPLPAPIGNTAPVNAVAAICEIEFVTNPGLGDEVILELDAEVETYFFVAGAPAEPFEVELGTDFYESIVNLQAAINSSSALVNMSLMGTPGATVDGGLEAITPGAHGNSIAITVPESITAVTGFIGGAEATATPPYLRTEGGFLYVQEAGVWKEVALSTLTPA